MANGSNGSGNRPNRGNGKLNFSTVILAVGVLLLIFGVWQLAERILGVWYSEIWRVVSTVLNIVWPVTIIAIGLILILLAHKGILNLNAQKKLYRSTRNRKLAGVCGGIAAYLDIEPMTVRVVAIVLTIPLWQIIIPLYALCWIFIPSDTKNYNNWV